MTDTEYDLLNEMGMQCERLSCLAVLLDAFASISPFSFSSDDPARQREERKNAIRLLSCICDLAQYYSDESHKTLSSMHKKGNCSLAMRKGPRMKRAFAMRLHPRQRGCQVFIPTAPSVYFSRYSLSAAIIFSPSSRPMLYTRSSSLGSFSSLLI